MMQANYNTSPPAPHLNKAEHTETLNLTDSALFFTASLGWRVFPLHAPEASGQCSCGRKKCASLGKHPRTRNGVKDATTDEATIRQWWGQWPNANIGVATGRESGIIVLDIDKKPGLDGEDSLEGKNLPDTAEQITGSGGRHLIFKYPEDGRAYKSATNLLPGIDSRADGGYIVAPPSLHASGVRYVWELSSDPSDINVRPADAPQWFLELIAVKERPDEPQPTEAPACPDDIAELLKHIPAEDYKEWVEVGMSLHRLGFKGAFRAWDEWSEQSEKYTPGETAEKWMTFRKEGNGSPPVAEGTLRRLAEKYGWEDPAKADGREAAKSLLMGGMRGAKTRDADEPWDRVVPLDAPDLPSIDLNYLPTWSGDYARALSIATETPPELAAGMVLAACATASARRLQVNPRPGYFEPCNLWMVVALPPSNRKSEVQKGATSPVLDWERKQSEALEPEITRITSEIKTMEARIKEHRSRAAREKDHIKAKKLIQAVADMEADLPVIPTVPQLWTSDATPERLGSLLAHHGECMAWLSSEGGIFDLLQGRYSNGILNLDLVLKAHNGDHDRVDRGSRPPVFLRYPRLTIGLSPQPDVLHGLAFKPGFRGRGLLARFLYLLPPSPLGYRVLETDPVPRGIRDSYEAGIRAMLDWEPNLDDDGRERPYTLKLIPEAYEEWRDFWHGVEKNMIPGREMEHFTDWAGKAPGAAARLAGVLHGIKHAHGAPWEAAITAETMTSALELMTVITKHSTTAMGVMGADPSVAAAKKVWEWINKNRLPRFAQRRAFEALKGTFPRVIKLEEALEPLKECSYIRIHAPEKGGPGRPPSDVIEVNPAIVEGWK